MNDYEKITLTFSERSELGFSTDYEIETDSKICEVTENDNL
jgi:hypothetical protein